MAIVSPTSRRRRDEDEDDDRRGKRVRSRQPRRPGTLTATKSGNRDIATPERRRLAARNLVTAPDKRPGPFGFSLDPKPPRDKAGDQNALLQAPIAGLSEGAVDQVSEGQISSLRTEAREAGGSNKRTGGFQSVTDRASGFTVPDQGDKVTREAFKRFFDTSLRPGTNSQIPGQADRDRDPTRAAFQNRFFPSETLSDAGIKKKTFFGTFER